MKRFLIVFTSLLLTLCFLRPVRASAYIVDSEDYDLDDITFNLSSNLPDMEDFPYWMIALNPSCNADGSYKSCWLIIECFSCSTDNVYFKLGNDGYYFQAFNENGVNFSYSRRAGEALFNLPSPNLSYTLSLTTSSYSEFNLARCVFDNYHESDFPFSLIGNPESYKSHACVLYSNFDIYGSDGIILQYANTADLKAHAPFLRDSLIDYTSYVPPTTYNYEIQEGDSETLQTSKGIYARVQDVIQAIANLPHNIANALSSLFTSLQNGILSGLETLFVPSDNLFIDLIDLLHSRFNFVFQIADLADYILHANFDTSSQTPPDFTITLPESWGGREYHVFAPDGDNLWRYFNQYRTFAHSIIIAFATYFAIRKAKKRLPALLNAEEFKN